MKLTANDYLIRDTFKRNEIYMYYASVKSDRFFAWLSGVDKFHKSFRLNYSRWLHEAQILQEYVEYMNVTMDKALECAEFFNYIKPFGGRYARQ